MDRSIFDELQTFKDNLGDLNLEMKFIWVNPET